MDKTVPQLFNEICDLTGALEKRVPAPRTGAGDGLILQQLLSSLKQSLLTLLSEHGFGDLKIKVGSGNGYVAKVPWVFISTEPGPVASKIGLAICFARNGGGVVIGKMYPMGVSRGQEMRSKMKHSDNFLDVDGDSINTRYNDRFVNPKDIPAHSVSMNKIWTLLASSLKDLHKPSS